MAEQLPVSSSEIPSISNLGKKSDLLERLSVSSLHRSLSNKLNVVAAATPPPSVATISASSSASSTASLAAYCIETGSVAQSVRRRQSLTNTTVASCIEATVTSLDENHLINDDDNRQEPLPDVDESIATSDGDNESFDDEDDTTIDESLYPSLPLSPPNFVLSLCPVCMEHGVLQVSPCCSFLCCNNCWRAHISATVNDGRIKVSCAASECHKYLTRESIVNFVRCDPSLHERYLKLYINANQNPRAKTCPRCCHLYSLDTINISNSSHLNDIKKKKATINKKIPKQVQCSECSLVWCFRCAAPWHENMTCKQFIKGDKLLSKWINEKNDEQWNARKCPKCSSLIQRAGGCPHMTCQSCSCEFCYLCGRRYVQIPLIGQHSNKFSMFGCPYNFFPEKPWLRRTIRGMIATGVVVASPIIVVGAVTAAVTVLPPVGIYKLVKFVRARRHTHNTAGFAIGEPFLIEPDLDDPLAAHHAFHLHLHDEDLPAADIMRALRERIEGLPHLQTTDNDEEHRTTDDNEISELAIFANMDVEHLFSDDDNEESNKQPLDFRTCPTTPAFTLRKRCGQSLSNLTAALPPTSIIRHSSISTEFH